MARRGDEIGYLDPETMEWVTTGRVGDPGVKDGPLFGPPPTARGRVFAAVHAERERQTEKWGDQWGAGNTPPETKLAILVEEVGEIAKEVLESGGKETPHLAKELTQLVAVGVAWLESIDGEGQDVE